MVEALECFLDPESYAGRSLVLLVGPPMPDRSKGGDQTKHDPPLQDVKGVVIGLTTAW